ncbi:MAG: hypothetical protein ACREPA_05155 [Candidatus Dormibacteraceae bacterium]
MVTTRILDRRRLANPSSARASRRRPLALAGDVSSRLRVGAFGRVYVAAAVILLCLIVYLFQVAQVTKASYDIAQLRGRQAQLLAEQEQLRYQEANLTAPARIQQEAVAAGMQRTMPSQYVAYQPVQVDVAAPPSQVRPDRTPLWQQAVAAIFHSLGSRDALASGQ